MQDSEIVAGAIGFASAHGLRLAWYALKVLIAFMRARASETPTTADDALWQKADELAGDRPPEQ